MDDIVTARFHYRALDRDGATKLRLGSMVTHVHNVSGGVEIGYVRGGEPARIRATACVLAGSHMMIPYLLPEFGSDQRDALAMNVKAPLVYVNVAVRNWHPWVRLGVHEVTNPMGFFSRVKLDYPVSLGDYRCPRSPDEPIVLHLVHVPTAPDRGMDARAQHRAGRNRLFETTYGEFEERVRDELTRMLGPGVWSSRTRTPDGARTRTPRSIKRSGRSKSSTRRLDDLAVVLTSRDDRRRPW